MASLKNSIAIRAPVERVFAYVDDPRNLPDWLPGMIEVRNVQGQEAGQQQEWSYKMAGVRLHGEAVVVEHVRNERAVHQIIGMIHSTFSYSVETHDEGTRLTVQVDYTIPIPVLGKLAERLILARNARELDLALVNLKETVEGSLSW